MSLWLCGKMAVASIHVQYDSYTVTQSNTSIKEQSQSDKQATFMSPASEGAQASSVKHWRLHVCIIHIDPNQRNQEEKFIRLGEFQATLAAWRSMQCTFYITHLLQGDRRGRWAWSPTSRRQSTSKKLVQFPNGSWRMEGKHSITPPVYKVQNN